MNYFKYIFLIALVAFSGCTTLSTRLGYQKLDAVNAKIAALEADSNKKISALSEQIKAKEKEVADIQQNQLQKAADELFLAKYAFTLNLAPDRNSIVVNYHVKSAADYIHLAPSTDVVSQYINIVKTELDETKTSLADLEQKYNIEHDRAEKLASQKTVIENEKNVLFDQKSTIENDRNQKLSELQTIKDDISKNLLNTQQEQIKNEKDRKALIQKLMYYTGGLAVLALIATIYLPVMKSESAILAGVMGAVTICLPFIEPWMLGYTALAAVILLIGWLIYKHHSSIKSNQSIITLESKVSKNLVNAIQDIKEKNEEVYTKYIKPVLEEWNTTVTHNADGTTTKTTDTEVTKAITSKLIESDRK